MNTSRCEDNGIYNRLFADAGSYLPGGIGDGHIYAQVMVWGLFWLLVIPIKIWIAFQILLWVYKMWLGVL